MKKLKRNKSKSGELVDVKTLDNTAFEQYMNNKKNKFSQIILDKPSKKPLYLKPNEQKKEVFSENCI